jgi:hypothetical protein
MAQPMKQPHEDLINQIKSKWIEKLESANLEPTDEGVKAFVDDISRFLRNHPDQAAIFRGKPEELERAVEDHVVFVRKSVGKFLFKAKAGETQTGVVDAHAVKMARASCGPHHFGC